MTAVAFIGKYGLVLSGQHVLERAFKGFTLCQIDPELFTDKHEVAPSIAVAGGKLIDKLFDAGRTPTENAVLFALSKAHFLVERSFQ
jgi:hypothetical protein